MNPQAWVPTPEQDLALDAAADYVLVTASAGTGKTQTLVEKVLRVVRAGRPIERLAVITFTTKAADELRQKLFTAFQDDAQLRPQRLTLPQAHISTIDSFCTRLLREHGLAIGIDPAFRVLAPPDDEVALAEIHDRLFHHWYLGRGPEPAADADAWEGVPARGSREHHEFLRLVDLCRYREGRELLKDEIVSLAKLARIHPDPQQFIARLERGVGENPPAYTLAYARLLDRTWRTGVEAYGEVLRCGARQGREEKFVRHRELYEAFERAPWPQTVEALAADLPGALTRLRAHLERAGCVTAKGPWAITFPNMPQRTTDGAPYNALAKQLLDAARNDRPGPLSWAGWPAREMHAAYQQTGATVSTLIALTRQTIAAYERHKADEGLLDFADLELQTRRLLLAQLPSLRGRFDAVFVDEFQDINDLQADIVEHLAPTYGRFLVGDVKQCIYQFRLSNPEIFRELIEGAQWRKPGPKDAPPFAAAPRVVVPLGTNFRSRRPIITWVNSIFRELFTPAMIGSAYDEVALTFGYKQGLEAGATPPASERRGCAPVEVHVVGDADEGDPESRGTGGRRAKLSGAESLAAEAQIVAERLHALARDHFEVFDRDRKVWRPFDLNDVAILLRSPGAAGGPFAQALQAAGIPAVYGIQPFFEREEIVDCLQLLRILDNAHDDIALAGVLRAPTIGFDDADLMRLRLLWPASDSLLTALRATAADAPDIWSGERGDRALVEEPCRADLARRCARFLTQLDDWRRRTQTGELAEAVAAACAEAGLTTAAASREDGLARVSNLQQLIALARAYSDERGHSLPGFVRYLAAIEAGGGPEPVATGGLAEPAVRIYSMHKSKGLQFPIVVLPLLGRSFNFVDMRKPVLTGEDWIGLDHFEPGSYVKTPTIARSLLAEERRRGILEEELRVLYVAMTRAVEKLILTATLPGAWEKTLAGLALWRGPQSMRETAAARVRRPGEWILGVLHQRDALIEAARPDTTVAIESTFELTRHTRAAIAARAPQAAAPAAPGSPLAGAAAIDEPRALRALPELGRRVETIYPHAAATRLRGKYWVTEVKRLVDLDRAEEERATGTDVAGIYAGALPGAAAGAAAGASPAAGRAGAAMAAGPVLDTEATQIGRRLHAVMQEIDFVAACAGGPEATLACAQALAQRGELPPDWVDLDHLQPVVAFLGTPLAAEMAAAQAAGLLEREASFALKMTPGELARVWPQAAQLSDEEWVLIQGQIDALWRTPDGGYRVVDFKTDRLETRAALDARAQLYRPQMLLYRAALAKLWGAARVDLLLYFLRAEQAVPVIDERAAE
jgi:ATP-dependent helicase/nuclease subunit A